MGANETSFSRATVAGLFLARVTTGAPHHPESHLPCSMDFEPVQFQHDFHEMKDKNLT